MNVANVVLHYITNERPWTVTGKLIQLRMNGELPAVDLWSDRFNEKMGFLLDDSELVKMELIYER